MSTRSSIAIQNADGTIEGIYCHFDGYISHHGPILMESYNTEERVRALISLGDMSSLGRSIGDKHDFNARPDDTCTYYGRDRGEDGTEKRTYENEQAWIKELGQAYNYLFVPDRGWLVAPYQSGFVELATALFKESEHAAE